MRKIKESIPTEIIDLIMANLLGETAKEMETTKDTFIRWPNDFPTVSYHSRSLRQAHTDLHNAALVSKKFRKSANHYLYRMLEINGVHGLMDIWKSLSKNPANAASIRYLLCCLSFDPQTATLTVSQRIPDLFAQIPRPRWADGIRLSKDDVHPRDDFARKLLLDLIRRCSKLKRLFLHRGAAPLIRRLLALTGLPQSPRCALGQTLCALAFEHEMGLYPQKTCGEHLQGCVRLVMPCLRVIQIMGHDGNWWIVLENSRKCPSSTVVQRILSLAMNHDGHHNAHFVLQYVGLQDMRRLQKFEVRTCLLFPENDPQRPALPLGSHDLNHELAEHAKNLKILHIDAPNEYSGNPTPYPDDNTDDEPLLLTCLPSLRTLVSLHISLHLLFPTQAALLHELEREPHEQKYLATFLTQCPETLQNIHFIEHWHFKLGRPRAARENEPPISQVTLIKLTKYMCENWLTHHGRPQNRTLQLTPELPHRYARHTHAYIMNLPCSLGRLRARCRTAAKADTYTYQIVEEVSYEGVHEQLLPLELVIWV